MIYIFDIDGTLANPEHRLHFIQKDPPDWSAFYQACDKDEPIRDVLHILRMLKEEWEIVLVSGRSDECIEKTRAWLIANNAYFDALYMRKAGDYRPDYLVKAELLDQIYKDYDGYGGSRGGKLILGVFEDRDQVVKMYRERGLRVFQVADGKF